MSKSGYRKSLSKLGCFEMAEENEKVWFVRLHANGLYEYDKTKNSTKCLTHFADFPIDKEYLYVSIQKADSLLILAPASASKVMFYDLINGKAEYLELMPVDMGRRMRYTGVCNFLKSYRHGDNVYLFGFEYPGVLKIDVKTKQIVYLTDWVKEVEHRIKKMSVTMGYVSDYVAAGDCVWALCECANAVLRLDLRTDEITVIDICSDLDIRVGICFDGNFWVTGYSEKANKLLKYSSSFVLEKEIEIASSEKNGDEYDLSLQDEGWTYFYYPIIDLGKRLLLFSVCPDHVYELDKRSNRVQICSAFEELLEMRDEKLHDMGILAPRKKGNRICFITGSDFRWNEYDFLHDMMSQYEVCIESDEELLQKAMTGKMLTENTMERTLGAKLTLSCFLKFLADAPQADNMENGGRSDTKRYEENDKGVSVI